jgi:hypothetical protein
MEIWLFFPWVYKSTDRAGATVHCMKWIIYIYLIRFKEDWSIVEEYFQTLFVFSVINCWKQNIPLYSYEYVIGAY